jgi:hypothetical protein
MVGHRHSTPETPDVQAGSEAPAASVYLQHTITRSEVVKIYGEPILPTDMMRVGEETVAAYYGVVYSRFTVHGLISGWMIHDCKTGNTYFGPTLDRTFVQRALDGDKPDFVTGVVPTERPGR